MAVPSEALAQGSGATGSRGENFSAKPAPQLFASDCTGSSCHKGPQGLAKGSSQFGLAGFLREHYTNSRESAASLAKYLIGLANAPSDARTARGQPAARASRAAARSDDDAPSRARREVGETTPKPAAPARGPRGQQAASAPPSPPEPAPPVPPEPPEAASPPAAAAIPSPPAPPPAPPKPQFDIFD